jgi:hypothetical protein
LTAANEDHPPYQVPRFETAFALEQMKSVQLLQRSLSYYWPTHLAVVLGVATSVAVLTGALMVGDSVRTSLRDLLLNRLGNTDLVISASGYCREQLAQDLESNNQFAKHFRSACPLILRRD